MQADAEGVKIHRHHRHQIGGEETFQHIEHSGLDICPAILVFHRQVESGHNDAHAKQHPAEEEKQVDSGLDPREVENLRAHVAHLGEHIGDGIIEGVEEPFHQIVPNGVDDGVANALEHPADGGGDTAD